MSDFVPRLTAPQYGDKYYNKKGKGGYNPCIIGNYPYNSSNPTGYLGLNVLPNCTGWATGRFAEIIGEPRCQFLGNTNAKNYYQLAVRQGLEVGQEPRLGACAVWDDGQYGHVGIVERLLGEDAFLMSQSGWFSRIPVWWGTHYRGASKNWVNGTDYTWMKNYKIVGFVYNPAVEEEEVKQEDFNRMMAVWLINQANKPADTYADPALKWVKDNGLMTGDKTGNQMPQSFLKREDMAVMLMAYNKKFNE